jgi:hypothetical protein
MRFSLLWDLTQSRLVVDYRHFSIFKLSSSVKKSKRKVCNCDFLGFLFGMGGGGEVKGLLGCKIKTAGKCYLNE